MAEATLPPGRSTDAWLDRPLLPSSAILSAVAARWEVLSYSSLLVVGFILRIWDVGSRAVHHDESLHAYYAWRLYTGQGYTYDPLMHGPLKFEMTSFFYLLFGDSEFSARLFPVILGTALIVLPFFLRHHLTRPGALAGALFLTISPTFLYFSRFIRDDVPLAFFSLTLFICLVRYLETHRSPFLYTAAAVMALAMASMEAAYLLFFIFGTFIAFEALREYLDERDGPVLRAFKDTRLDVWLTAVAIFIVIIVVLYSTFFTNPYGIWDPRYPLTGPTAQNRKDIIGGILYWEAQHAVARGGQPWYYYLLVLPLYEQIAVVFGLAGAVYAMVRRSLVSTFLLWWAASALLLYSWAGEKMPWLSMHIALPLILLAALFTGKVFTSGRGGTILLVGAIAAALLGLEIHSAFALSYRDAANPTEMLIYVQTSQDVPRVVNEVDTLSARTGAGKALPIGLDDADVGGWPFIWYLRNYTNVTETTNFAGPTCGSEYCSVMLMLGPEYDQYASTLDKHYVVQRYRWNWWFPEDYKQWFPQHVGSLALAASGRGQLDPAPIGTPSDWQHLWDWLVYRTPFGTRGERWLYFLVRRDLVPGSSQYATTPPLGTGPIAPPASTFRQLPGVFSRGVGAPGQVTGPHGLAAGQSGNLYVADPINHRIVELSPSGTMVRQWGTVGTGNGQFNKLDSPQAVAVGPDGNVYVADTWNQRIQVFTPTGQFLRSWGSGVLGSGPGQFYGPRSLAVSAKGDVYVADTGNERIQVFDRTGHFLRAWGTKGNRAGQFTEPSSLALGPGGRVYVADYWNQRIQVFTPSGVFLRSWPVSDWTSQSYDEPYIAVDSVSGTVYATEPQQGRVVAWTSTGHPIGAFGSGRFTLPIGVAVLRNGSVAVTDATANSVSLFHPKARSSSPR